MAHQWLSFLVRLALFFACHHAISMASNFSNETDRHALLSFKSMLSNDSRISLASWNDSIHFCEWSGITCGKRHPQRVVSLVLASRGLSGSVSSSIANLTFLNKMDLSSNQLVGPIPQEIGQLFRMRRLNLGFNSLEGEYGMANRISTRGDVYSYGILLLEMFTGKSPTDGVFVEGQSLRKFVEMALPQQGTEVIDPQLLSIGDGQETDDGQSLNAGRAIECIGSVLQIGIMCSSASPAERLEMGEVTRELHKIREFFLKTLVSG